MVKLNKVDQVVIEKLRSADNGLSLQEIAESSGESSKRVFKSLRKLFEHELVTSKERKYWLTEKQSEK